MKILMVRLDSDCETKIHQELKRNEVIKTIQTNDSNEVNTDRGVHSTQTVGGAIADREERHASRGQRQLHQNKGMIVRITQRCVTSFKDMNKQTVSRPQWQL